MPPRRPNKSKNPPFFSHDFFIQNHADIVSCFAMVFVFGLMFTSTNPVASLFVAMQYNITANDSSGVPQDVYMYTSGVKDICTIFFYFLIAIVLHAVIQEYILDKINRKMRLSKLKQSKFNESGQLLIFYILSTCWGYDIIFKSNLIPSVSNLWVGYPHSIFSFSTKFFFICQVAYWLHCYPELYLQKVKKEEMGIRIQYTSLYLIFVILAYRLSLVRICLCLLALHYSAEFVFHLSRLIYYADRTGLADKCFAVWKGLFVIARLGTITLSVLTFWHGLQHEAFDGTKNEASDKTFSLFMIRFGSLTAVCALQAWLMWNFIMLQLRHIRENKKKVH